MTERIDNNNRSIQLIRRDLSNPATTSQAGHSDTAHRSRSRKRTKGKQKPFGVNVKRRWNTAKESILRHLNIYTQPEQIPIGIIIDYWA